MGTGDGPPIAHLVGIVIVIVIVIVDHPVRPAGHLVVALVVGHGVRVELERVRADLNLDLAVRLVQDQPHHHAVRAAPRGRRPGDLLATVPADGVGAGVDDVGQLATLSGQVVGRLEVEIGEPLVVASVDPAQLSLKRGAIAERLHRLVAIFLAFRV